MERIIVTGANGFLGVNIAAACLAAGYAVASVDSRFDNPAYSALPRENLRLIESDCLDMPAIHARGLIHAAFITATPEERGETAEANLRANIEPMLSVMEYARSLGVERAIFVSSAAVHSRASETMIRESLPPQPLGFYGVAKSLMEQLVETLRTADGRDCLCVRPGAIYGPYEYRRSTRPKLSRVALMMESALTRGEIVVERPHERSEWTFAPDIGRALIALLEAPSLNHALYQVASGETIANLALARKIASLLGGVKVRVAPSDQEQAAQASPPRMLDASRLARDAGFRDWTAMSAATLRPALDSLSRRFADA